MTSDKPVNMITTIELGAGPVSLIALGNNLVIEGGGGRITIEARELDMFLKVLTAVEYVVRRGSDLQEWAMERERAVADEEAAYQARIVDRAKGLLQPGGLNHGES